MKKRIVFAFLFVMLAFGMNAQSVTNTEDGKYSVYCNVVGYNFLGIGKVKVMLDMGYSSGQLNSLYDERGKKIRFNTMMQVLDYMAKRGWRLVNTYYVSASQTQNVVNYVMEKRVTSDEQKTEGLTIKPEKPQRDPAERGDDDVY